MSGRALCKWVACVDLSAFTLKWVGMQETRRLFPYSPQIAKTILLFQWRTPVYFSPGQSCFSFVFPYILWKSKLHQGLLCFCFLFLGSYTQISKLLEAIAHSLYDEIFVFNLRMDWGKDGED